MTAMDNAIAEFQSQEPEERLSYRKLAAKYGVDRTTLSRRCRGVQQPVEAREINKQKLHPQQEHELVEYINRLTEKALPPTREMTRRFAAEMAHEHVGDGWVTRFIQRNKDYLISKWTKAMDAVRHHADSEAKYDQYFDLLHGKITQYEVEPAHTYNMDEKGFAIGVIGKQKRIFSKRAYEAGEVTQLLQDGSREWITVLAGVCADGSTLPSGLIYQSKNCTLRNNWVEDIKRTDDVFVTSSPTGWTNNDIGLAWLEQVFDRHTKRKAGLGRKWRLLIVDGHGSHVTQDFLDYCMKRRILVAVYPPHSTHSLQPLDVVCFSPLAASYSKELSAHIFKTQGLVPITKGDFFLLFRAAWTSTMTEKLILKSFESTGIFPMDREAVLKRFRPTTPRTLEEDDEQEPQSSPLIEADWRKIRRVVEQVVKDGEQRKAQKIAESVHHLQVTNELLREENNGLQKALKLKQMHKKKGKVLNLQQRAEYHSGAVLWSPRKLKEAEYREAVRLQEEEEENLEKQTIST